MSYREALREFRRDYWQTLMIECNGNAREAAKRAKVRRTAVYRSLALAGVRFVAQAGGHRGD